MLTRRKRIILFWISVAVFVAVVPAVLLYALGYRIDENWNLRETGGFYISSSVIGSEIFIDGKIQKKTGLLQSGVFVQSLAPRSYHIKVAREDYHDWSKELRVLPQAVTEAHALLIPRDPAAEVLWRGNFQTLKASGINPVLLFTEKKQGGNFLTFYLPEAGEFLSFEALGTTTAPFFKKSFDVIRWRDNGVVLELDGKTRRISFDFSRRTFRFVPLGTENPNKTPEDIERENTRFDNRAYSNAILDSSEPSLLVTWIRGGALPHYLEHSQEKIIGSAVRNFEFYPQRRDALIAAFENGIWVVELDGRGGRIVTPLYKGKEPVFAVLPGRRELYILDDGILIKLSIIPKENA